MYEAFFIANLFFLMNETNWNSFDDEYYILSTSWFEKWKNYVNFDFFIINIDKFLKLNNIPENIDDNKNSEENFLLTLDDSIKCSIDKYFEFFFLKNNSDNYPGVISNKDLLYDKSFYYIDFQNKKSLLNYNILDQYENGKDFFLVTAPIWKYFKKIYGEYPILCDNSDPEYK